MSQARSIFDLSVVSAGPISRGRAVGFGGAQIAATNAKALGIAKTGAAAAGEDVLVAVMGTAIAETGGAVSVGDSLRLDSQGRVIVAGGLGVVSGGTPVTSTAASGSAILSGGDPPHWIVGDALSAGAASGAFIEILLRR